MGRASTLNLVKDNLIDLINPIVVIVTPIKIFYIRWYTWCGSEYTTELQLMEHPEVHAYTIEIASAPTLYYYCTNHQAWGVKLTHTYAELKSLVQNYLQNTETQFVSDLPKLIEQTEERILNY